jgi:hypothetical protein
MPVVDVGALAMQLDDVAGQLSTPGAGGWSCVFTTTDGLMALALDAHRRDSNRQAELPALARDIDPSGVHVLTLRELHNDVEWRTWWMVKLRDVAESVNLMLDVSFESFDTCTRRVMVSAPRAATA